jgi:hypothetical protein
MNCKKCKTNCEEGFLYDGKEWSLCDKESSGLDVLYDFYCQGCVERVLSLLITNETTSTSGGEK